MPLVFATYSLAYVDRTNYGFGAAAGLAKTLHITESRNALLAALFFLGYFLFQIPGAAYARRRSARSLIFFAVVSWGVLAMLTGIVKSFWGLALVRLTLGMSESFILPGMLLLLSQWFTRGERSRANTFLILGNPVTVLWMSAATGFLMRRFGWQTTFILEGIPSILWGFVWYWLIRDKPAQAGWLDTDSRLRLEEALQREQAAIPAVGSVGQAFRSPIAIALSVQYFLWSIGVYGFVLWLPSIVQRGAARGIAVTGLLSAIPYAAAAILMLLTSYFSDRRQGTRQPFIWPSLLVAGFALLGSFFTAGTSFPIAFAFLVLAGGLMYAPYGPFFALIAERFPRNVSGEVTALVNGCGALGSFVGSYAVGLLQARTGSPRAGFLLMSVSVLCASLIILLLPKPARGSSAA